VTPRQQRFVAEYLRNPDPVRAAIRAGYAPRNARDYAARLMANRTVTAAIERALADRSRRTGVSQDRVIRELARIAFADLRHLLRWTGDDGADAPPAETAAAAAAAAGNARPPARPAGRLTLFDSDALDADIAACIAEVTQARDGTIRVKLHDKQAALVTLGRHLGMFRDRGESARDAEAPTSQEQIEADADAFTRAIAGLVARLAPPGGAGGAE